MARLCTRKNGARIIQFARLDGCGKVATISLGKVSKKAAEAVLVRVDALIEAKVMGVSLSADLGEWLAARPDEMFAKLVTAGLVEPRQKAEAVSLGAFLTNYVDTRRTIAKPATLTAWGNPVRDLKDFFGADRAVDSITEADAMDFKLHLEGRKLSAATVCKRLQTARQFFNDARRRKLLKENPFTHVRGKAGVDLSQRKFLTLEETERLLGVCNPVWRVIVALGRFGGARIPSEALTLKWEDVDFQRGRVTFTTPKTEHHPGKGRRTIPMFPPLRPILEEAWELARPGQPYVVDADHYRATAQTERGWNSLCLNTQFRKLVKRAGLTPWPKLLHTLRASCETELAQSHPIHQVCQWIGNSPTVAARHYLMTTEEDMDRAAGLSQRAASGAATSVSEGCRQFTPTGPRNAESPEKQGFLGTCGNLCETAETPRLGDKGLEPLTLSV